MHRMPYKLKVSFRKRATNLRGLLRKDTYEDKASYASSVPCNIIICNKLHTAERDSWKTQNEKGENVEIDMCVYVCVYVCVRKRECVHT